MTNINPKDILKAGQNLREKAMEYAKARMEVDKLGKSATNQHLQQVLNAAMALDLAAITYVEITSYRRKNNLE